MDFVRIKIVCTARPPGSLYTDGDCFVTNRSIFVVVNGRAAKTKPGSTYIVAYTYTGKTIESRRKPVVHERARARRS